jgi:subtilisin-like proprotein convertase family protein
MNQRLLLLTKSPHKFFILCLILAGLLFLPGLFSSAMAYPDSESGYTDTRLGVSTGNEREPLSAIQINDGEPGSDSPAIVQEGVYLPLAFMQFYSEPPPPPLGLDTKLYCNSDSFGIPDDNSQGVNSTISIDDPRVILDLDVRLEASHSWISDLIFTLTHEESGNSITLIDRPGIPDSSAGCSEDDIGAILDDEITGAVENKCSSTAAAISGIYRPVQPLSSFEGEGITGTWILNVSDHNVHDTGTLDEWCIAAVIDDVPSPPPPDPPTPDLPKQAQVAGLSGRSQSLPLSCESRSAVDWATFFGVPLDEVDFHFNLPVSDNPDIGFVGNVYGSWGQLPPDPYGVHAEPIAAQLRDHGLSAYAHRPLSWDGLRAEIAEGRPVIVWIVGSYSQGQYDYVVNGIPQYYLPQEGHMTVVTPYEHTVIVSGYTQDTVTYLNGGNFYTRTINRFLDSWSVMRNMAITTQP